MRAISRLRLPEKHVVQGKYYRGQGHGKNVNDHRQYANKFFVLFGVVHFTDGFFARQFDVIARRLWHLENIEDFIWVGAGNFRRNFGNGVRGQF